MNTKIVMSAAAILALAAGLYLGSKTRLDAQAQMGQLQSQMTTGTLLPSDLKTIPDVSFIDQNGASFSKEDFTGKWQLLFFGYTHCPDVCPMTMSLTDKVHQLVNNADDGRTPANKLEVIFISVDPERDTPDHLKAYVAFFNPDFVGLSSSTETLNALTHSLGVVYQRVENKDHPDNYLMDHSANLLLVAPSGNIVALFTSPHESEKIAKDISLIQTNLSSERSL